MLFDYIGYKQENTCLKLPLFKGYYTRQKILR